jgi:ribonuclease D
VKVLHSAVQDLEFFLHALGRVPGPVFDTQIAAAVCGHGD